MSGIKKFFVITLAFIMHIVGMTLSCVVAYNYLKNVLTFELIMMFYLACTLSFLAIVLLSIAVTNKTVKHILRVVAGIPIIVSIGYTIVFLFGKQIR